MKIYLAGRNGLVGSALCRYYRDRDAELISSTSAQVDLRDCSQADRFSRDNKPDVMILSAAKRGGIEICRYAPLENYRDNLAISMNTLNVAAENGIEKVINIGVSCVYSEGLKGTLTEDILYSCPV